MALHRHRRPRVHVGIADGSTSASPAACLAHGRALFGARLDRGLSNSVQTHGKADVDGHVYTHVCTHACTHVKADVVARPCPRTSLRRQDASNPLINYYRAHLVKDCLFARGKASLDTA